MPISLATAKTLLIQTLALSVAFSTTSFEISRLGIGGRGLEITNKES